MRFGAKIIRDGIIIEGDKSRIETRPANSAAGKFMGLINKLHEEVGEVAKAPSDPYEYADVLEALEETARMCGVDWARVLEAKAEKLALKGGFRKGLVMMDKEL